MKRSGATDYILDKKGMRRRNALRDKKKKKKI